MAGQQTKGSRTAGNALGDGKELPTDRRARQQAGRRRDAPLEDAYNAGLRGDDPAPFRTSDELYGYYQDGQRAGRQQSRQSRVDQLRGDVGTRAGSAASDGAGFVLGLIGYALLANYLRGGTPQVRAWFAAKFLNRTSSTGARVAKPSSPTPNTALPSSPTPNTAQPAQAMRVGT